ncbi:MAG: X-Pro aminopeptidase [Acidimicrobiaceae bacterium]|nr:X-Pro aminopeptidase [Acidimicrobiaceae bacterium]
MRNSINARLELVRREMSLFDIDALIVPRADEYLGEYVPPQNERLQWMTGFSGSAGIAVILKTTAAIFVDGRYTIQVKQQVPESVFEFHHLVDEPIVNWLCKTLEEKTKVGIDPRLHTLSWYQANRRTLAEKGIDLIELNSNPIDLHWHDRPAPDQTPIMLLNAKYTGENSIKKRQRIAAEIQKASADIALIFQLDSIAWLLNIRGRDVPRLPVLLAFATLNSEGDMTLYTDVQKLPKGFATHVGKGVTVVYENQLEEDLKNFGKQKKRILVDPNMANAWCQLTCQNAGAQLIQASDPVLIPKAQKNETELNGMRNCHIRDGSAVTRYLAWIDREVASGNLYNEGELSDKLELFRRELDEIHDLSFDTISAAGKNGALCHYNHLNGNPAELEMNNLYLVDSGGQYSDGTTDITRTVIIGEPTNEHRKMYTLVLKGHIALASAVFPKGTSGIQLDILARQFLWQEGLDYDHGTGHGVGAFLNVYEGPQRITKSGPQQALLPGMVVSNEPGYYQENCFGIRCENLVIVIERQDGWLAFETITFAPFDIRLVDTTILSHTEIEWLNAYHTQVYEKIAPLLQREDLQWLKQSTRHVA